MQLIATKSYTISVFIFWLYIFAASGDVIDSANNVAPSEKILSRKRRYLIFPKGSSIQLVYDSAVTIPDYTIYVVTGVTCALSWGLPDQPIYPEDNLMQHYEDGELPGLQYRNDVNVTENTSPTNPSKPSRTPSTATKIDNRTLINLIRLFYPSARRTVAPNVSTFNRNNYWNEMLANNKANSRITYAGATNNKKNYFNTHLPTIYSQSQANNYHYLDSNANNAFQKYLAETYLKPSIGAPWKMKLTKKSMTANEKQPTEQPSFKPKVKKLHTIYPAIIERNIRHNRMTREEKFYLDHHRNTRNELFQIIEKYLFAKGFNGTACVLKTLCEVGRKRSDIEPGSFLAEIVRAIFSLPEAQSKRVIEKRQVHYDEAHRHTNDCMQEYNNCPNSIWNVGYKLIEFK